MIELSKLTDGDRKRKVIWTVEPHFEKNCVLLGWNKQDLILAVPTGLKFRPNAIKTVNPCDVRFADDRCSTAA